MKISDSAQCTFSKIIGKNAFLSLQNRFQFSLHLLKSQSIRRYHWGAVTLYRLQSISQSFCKGTSCIHTPTALLTPRRCIDVPANSVTRPPNTEERRCGSPEVIRHHWKNWCSTLLFPTAVNMLIS